MAINVHWKGSKKWLVISGLLIALAIIVFIRPSNDYDLPKAIDFNHDIRPILSDNCFVCHGPDSSSRKANLRLDIRAAATAKLESGNRAIVPKRPSKSTLLQRISSSESDLQMPPPEMNKKLSSREIALLEKWIKQGAKWEPYWAFIPPKPADLLANIADESPPGIIDYFIHNKLKAKDLSAAPIASKNELIRRVSYLLTGLPPDPGAVQAFLTDRSDDAYEKMVDRYLASPHFGERWARHWMDLVRYGEYMGHEFDFPISGAWQYRDYLIRAFNEDVPYDLLVKEHLAGDMLKHPRVHPEEGFNESILGTGYFFLGEGKHSPVSLKAEELDRIDNMIDVTSKTFQALTVACARCHDHKFDPIPTTDYYAMYGMLESARIGPLPAKMNVENNPLITRLDAIKKEIRVKLGATLSATLKEQSKEEIAMQKAFINSLERDRTSSQDVPPSKTDTTCINVIGDFRNGSWEGWFTNGRAFGKSPVVGKPVFDTLSFQAVRLETGYASSQTYGSGIQGALHSPYFNITEDFIAVKARGKGSLIRIIVDNFQIIRYPLWGGLEKMVDNPEWETYFFDVSMLKGHKAYIVFLPGHYSNHQYKLLPDHYIDIQYAVAYDGSFFEPEMDPSSAVVLSSFEKGEELIAKWVNGETQAKEVPYLNFLLKESPDRSFITLVKEQNSLANQLHNPAHFIGVVEGDAVFSPVFIRGNKDQLSKEKVPRRFLSAIKKENVAFPQKGSGRLAWAESVVDPQNPLTSRVMVNRIWHHLFGRGIVETVDNFGLQGKMPTHPELLDYLSLYFIKEGWSIKNLIRQIVRSQSFKRSTLALSENEKIDPNNYFLHHFPIRRLEAEAIRDAMLATSGELDTTLFGESIPIHLTEFMTGRGRPSASGPLDGNGRRSIYITIRRNFIAPMMSVFDMPTPFSTFGKRNTTNVPAQSLTLMNDPFVHDQASKWADHLLRPPTTSTIEKIEAIYLHAFSRNPTIREVQQAENYLKELASNYCINIEEIKTDHQIWTDYCHAVFNLKEFIHLL